MAAPARKPSPLAEAAPPRPQLRPRALREAEGQAPQANEPRRLQERVAAAFTARETTALEKTLMRLIIVAATCLVVLSAAGQGGMLSGLFR